MVPTNNVLVWIRAWRGVSYPSLIVHQPPLAVAGGRRRPLPNIALDPAVASIDLPIGWENVGSTSPSPPPLESGPTAARVVRTPIRCPRRVAGVMGGGAQVSPTPSHPSPSPQTDPTGWPDAADPDADADGEGNPTPTPDTRRRRGRSRVRRPKIFLRAPRKEGGEGEGGRERKGKRREGGGGKEGEGRERSAAAGPPGRVHRPGRRRRRGAKVVGPDADDPDADADAEDSCRSDADGMYRPGRRRRRRRGAIRRLSGDCWAGADADDPDADADGVQKSWDPTG